MRTTVFWKVAGLLVAAQVATGLLAVGLGAYFARARSLELVRGSLTLRLDTVAEEVEGRARFDTTGTGAFTLDRRLQLDLAARFPDPVALLDADGLGRDGAAPAAAQAALDEGRIEVRLDAVGGGWAVAPLLAPDGLPAGGLLVRPLTRTLAEELRGTQEATRRALWTVAALSAALALALGALVTVGLVRPLRRMTRRVEALGEGDYADRLPDAGADELGRLSTAINEMAARVEESLDALRATDRLRRELVANVGHDLRTPLAAVGGYLEEAERLAAEGRAADAADALAVAQRQARHAGRLVADLFELAVLDAPSAAGALRREPVPLAELVGDAARSHRGAMEKAGLDFVVDVPPGLPTLDADGARLLRVLDNLLDNARQHTPPGGSIRLDAAVENGAARVRVRDTGAGIPAESLDAVFERYYRGEGARTRTEAGGTGLGLAIARAVARAHGGDLTAESAPGQGSTFTLTLPRPENP